MSNDTINEKLRRDSEEELRQLKRRLKRRPPIGEGMRVMRLRERISELEQQLQIAIGRLGCLAGNEFDSVAQTVKWAQDTLNEIEAAQ